MATTDVDLEARLLNAAARIPSDLKMYDGAREHWKETLGDPKHRGRTSAIVVKWSGAIGIWADEIDECAREAPQHVKAFLFDAAARLRNHDRDVPQMLTKAAAELYAEPQERAADKKPARDALEAAACQAVEVPPRTPNKRTSGNATVSARIMDAYQQDPERGGWSAQEWANYLGCVKSTVAESPAWEKLKLVKADQKLSKAKAADNRRR